MKSRSALGVICDRKVPLKLKGKSYYITIRLVMLGNESQQGENLNIVEMRMIRWHTDKFVNECILENIGVAHIVEKKRW